MFRTKPSAVAGVALITLALGACAQETAPVSSGTNPPPPAPPETPAPVNGWIEHSLKEGVIKLHPAAWRTDSRRLPPLQPGSQ